MSNPPRYDRKIARRVGFQWASETDLEGLQFWYGLKLKPSSNPAYAEKDAAQAEKLGYWVAWRSEYPDIRWKGVRGDTEVVAAQPSAKPAIHSWDEKAPAAPVERGDAWEGDDGEQPNW
jgi:hypothetical protein